MKIIRDRSRDIDILHLEGKLDAFQAGELEDQVNELIDKGSYHILLDMQGIDYLSSAGIRTLLVLMKRSRKLGGDIRLVSVGPYPRSVLELAGFFKIFVHYETLEEGIKQFSHKEQQENSKPLNETVETEDVNFLLGNHNGKTARIRITGSNLTYLKSACSLEEIVSGSLSSIKYSLGIGALGSSSGDNYTRMGELMVINGSVVWLPTDGHNTPDFLITAGKDTDLNVHTAFNIILEGDFNRIIRFRSRDPDGITLGKLYRELIELMHGLDPGFKGMLGLVIRADIGSIYGASIKKSPIPENTPANRELITHADNIRDWLDFQLDFDHQNSTALIVGVGIDSKNHGFSDDFKTVFQAGSDDNREQLLHNHAAIFKFIPESKDADLDLEEEIDKILSEGRLVGMEHLLERSTLKKGVIGLFRIDEIV